MSNTDVASIGMELRRGKSIESIMELQSQLKQLDEFKDTSNQLDELITKIRKIGIKLSEQKNKHKVEKVILHWSELSSKEEIEFDSIDQANAYIYRLACGIPQKEIGSGCYNKTKFSIIFDDGYIYGGRLDVKHPSERDNDTNIRKHIFDMIDWYTGQKKNPYCGMKKYIEWCKTYDGEKQAFQEIRDNYEI